MPKEIFRKLMHLTTQGIFMHNGKFYKQLDGISMGSPLGPTLASFFLGSLEKKIFDDETIDDETIDLPNTIINKKSAPTIFCISKK